MIDNTTSLALAIGWSDRFCGAMLGGAVGDALGSGVRHLGSSQIRATFGPNPVNQYLPVFGRPGAATEVSQLTAFVLEGLLRAKATGADAPDVIEANLAAWLYTQGVPWEYAMRRFGQTSFDPVGWLVNRPELYSNRNPAGSTLREVADFALTGKPDPGAGARTGRDSLGAVVWSSPGLLLASEDSVTRVLAHRIAASTSASPEVQGAAELHALVLGKVARGVGFRDAMGTVDAIAHSSDGVPASVQRTAQMAMYATSGGRRPWPQQLDVEFDLQNGPGELGIAFASVLCSHDFAGAVSMAVDHGGDSSVAGALAGQLAGALHGVQGIPAPWLGELELREIVETLGRDAAEAFPPPAPPQTGQWARRYVRESHVPEPLELTGVREAAAPLRTDNDPEQTTMLPVIDADLAEPPSPSVSSIGGPTFPAPEVPRADPPGGDAVDATATNPSLTPVGSAEVPESVGSSASAERAVPVESLEPVELGDPVGSREPVGLPESVGSREPVELPVPVGSRGPAESLPPGERAEPLDPAEPATPAESVEDARVAAVDPVSPVEDSAVWPDDAEQAEPVPAASEASQSEVVAAQEFSALPVDTDPPGGHAAAEAPGDAEAVAEDAVPSFTERVLGCFLGGALGDALGADVEFLSAEQIVTAWGGSKPSGLPVAYGVRGAITDDTQMTLYTAEGLVRARMAAREFGDDDPIPHVHLAYQRWLHTQGVEWSTAAGTFLDVHPEPDGWLTAVRGLFATRAPGKTVFRALNGFADGGPIGSLTEKINDSKGCGGVMRAAPAALYSTDPTEVFELAARTAALTHTHPAGYHSAGALAVIVQQALLGGTLDDGVWLALQVLDTWEGHEETSALLETAVEFASHGVPTPDELLDTLGGGWVGEQALAIAVCAALVGGDDVALALRVATHHAGDSDSTAAICGNIVGALSGVAALPVDWLVDLELRDVIEQVAWDCVAEFGTGEFAPDLNTSGQQDWERYPVRSLAPAGSGGGTTMVQLVPDAQADDAVGTFPAPKPAPRRVNGVVYEEVTGEGDHR